MVLPCSARLLHFSIHSQSFLIPFLTSLTSDLLPLPTCVFPDGLSPVFGSGFPPLPLCCSSVGLRFFLAPLGS